MGHWEAQASREMEVEPTAVWELWENPDRWRDWNPAIASASLDGSFNVGTTATIRFRGRPA